jgi:hypothetical protein
LLFLNVHALASENIALHFLALSRALKR